MLARWRLRCGCGGAAPIPSTLSILTYHHIAEDEPNYAYDPGVADATPAQFRRQMELVAKVGDAGDDRRVVRALDGAPLPKNPVMVTFDDGYKSCVETALPILKSVGLPRRVLRRHLVHPGSPAVLVGADRAHPQLGKASARAHQLPAQPRHPGARIRPRCARSPTSSRTRPSLDLERFLGELAAAFGVEWHREIESEHANKMVMTWDDVRALASDGMDVESHSRRHRVLQTLDRRDARDELAGSQRELETQLGRPSARRSRIRSDVGSPTSSRSARRSPRAGYKIGFTNASGCDPDLARRARRG